MPNMRPKLVVNEPTLLRPTAKQISATELSVVRSSAAARSRRRVSRYWCGDSPKAARNSRLKCACDRPAASRQVGDLQRLEVARVGEVPGLEQVAGGRDEGHQGRTTIATWPSSNAPRVGSSTKFDVINPLAPSKRPRPPVIR